MTVAELIEFLKTQPQDVLVLHEKWSEHQLLKKSGIRVATLGLPRPDGWVHNERPDKPTMQYLVFPG